MKNNQSLDNIFKNRKKLFWFVILFFWSMHWIVPYIQDQSNQKYVLIHTISIFVGFSLSLSLVPINKFFNLHKLPFTKSVLIIFIYSILCGFLWLFFVRVTAYFYLLVIFSEAKFILSSSSLDFISSMWHYSYPMLQWNSIYIGYLFWEEWNEQKIWTERERTLAKTAQLEMLRYQLNPHFLFNTLSSLRAMIRVNTEKAEEMITQISEFLRYSLLEGKNNEVPLYKEIEIIKNYLDIEKVRFGQKLLISYDIDKLAEYYPVPVFLLHPLIENTIKHGMKSSPIPLKISLSAKVVQNDLEIEVRNSGKWIEPDTVVDKNNTGTGLQNTRKRLEHSYPDAHKFEIIKENGSVRIFMRLRKELENEHGEEI
jgi:sensor histidine kinase YesM